jgi:hypothetical protein
MFPGYTLYICITGISTATREPTEHNCQPPYFVDTGRSTRNVNTVSSGDGFMVEWMLVFTSVIILTGRLQ